MKDTRESAESAGARAQRFDRYLYVRLKSSDGTRRGSTDRTNPIVRSALADLNNTERLIKFLFTTVVPFQSHY